MTTQNEMDGSFALGAELPPSAPVTQPDVTIDMTAISSDAAMDVAPPDVSSGIDPDTVSIYASNISAASTGDSNITAFDVVFMVSFTCPDTGTFSSYQVVKRIGVDKMKLANDAKMTTPLTIVEAKKPEQFVYNAARIKALAGLK